jgi:hypothetical protein
LKRSHLIKKFLRKMSKKNKKKEKSRRIHKKLKGKLKQFNKKTNRKKRNRKKKNRKKKNRKTGKFQSILHQKEYNKHKICFGSFFPKILFFFEDRNKIMGIISSLLDTDLYKFTMGQAVLHHFPGAKVEYTFRCRNENVDLTKYEKEIKREIQDFCALTLNNSELTYHRFHI